MSEQLQQQLAEYLKAILTAAQSGANFVTQQAPLVVQEKIAYGRVMETLWFVGVIVCLSPIVWLSIRYFKDAVKASDDGPVFLLNIIGIVGSLAAIWFAAQSAALVWFAPRLYILEWAMSLVKK